MHAFSRRTFLAGGAALPLVSRAEDSLLAYWPALDGNIATGDAEVDRAAALAVRTLKMNVSEKWGRLCPVAAPAWSRSPYPAWIHPFDNFWMGKVTPYLFPKEQVEWPVQLFAKYQRPTGMIGWGIHDVESPEAWRASIERMGPEKVREESANSRYIRDHLYVHQVYDLWWHYGDEAVARGLFGSCVKAFDYLYSMKDLDRDGLVESASILEDIDIGSTKERTGPNAAERFVDQAMLYGALLRFARMAEAMGEAAQAGKARERAATLKAKANERYWNEKGYYIFAVDSRTHEPILPEMASTYANGYAVLYGMVPPERVGRLLDYFGAVEFVVPGPVIVPPIKARTSAGAKEANLPMGVYANGGCGWGRGHLPSICLALYRHGREALAASYIRKMAAAAIKTGAFHEYWQWEKYTGKTTPGGCRDYSETSAAYLDAIIHGLFGLEATSPGWKTLRFTPRPIAAEACSIKLALPGGDFTAKLRKVEGRWTADFVSAARREVEVALPGAPVRKVTVG